MTLALLKNWDSVQFIFAECQLKHDVGHPFGDVSEETTRGGFRVQVNHFLKQEWDRPFWITWIEHKYQEHAHRTYNNLSYANTAYKVGTYVLSYSFITSVDQTNYMRLTIQRTTGYAWKVQIAPSAWSVYGLASYTGHLSFGKAQTSQRMRGNESTSTRQTTISAIAPRCLPACIDG